MNDNLLLGFFALYPIGFVCMATGYFLYVRHVWHRPDRKAQIKLIFTSGGAEEWQREPRAARILILLGALCGVVGSFGMLACIVF
ncbi:MAG: hypothetical protein M3R13_09235 [Armatimonadota bacterium]|nr:hypothetical protein [Armatimonadota bacterium]